VHARPAAPSLPVLQRFCFLSDLSNVQDPILSKSSLPNVQGEVYLSPRCRQTAVLCPCVCLSTNVSLPNVQGDVYLSTRRRQPAVLCPCVCLSTNVSTSSRLNSEVTPPVSIGPHPMLRIAGTLTRDYVNHFARWYRCHYIVVHAFLNMVKHTYAILKHCYLFHRLSMPCPILLHAQMQRSFFLKHDFKA